MCFSATLAGAVQWAKDGRLDEWVHRYLLGDGANAALSDGLKLERRYFIGVLEMPTALFQRCCGPEEGMPFRVHPERFRRKVDALKAAIAAGVALPPLIAQFTRRGFTLSDGNHRFEAYAQLGVPTVPVIVWITAEDEYRAFTARFGGCISGAAVVHS